jgi:ABC-type proline/glycine betaine transport system ATPase subunit
VQNNQHLGLVSIGIPLISNLDVWNNIALIRQYHFNINEDTAQQLVFEYLHRYDLVNIAYKRNPALTDEERFCVMLLRAVMLDNAVVVIDRPFQILSDIQDARFIYAALKKVDDSYRESHIFDYQWNAHKYRVDNDKKS